MAETKLDGWIKLHRKIQDCFIWSFEKPQYTLAWIDMLFMANYKDKQAIFDGKIETVKRGTFITSMVKLSERWNMNRKTVKTLLDILQDSGMITYKTTKKRTTVCIKNYHVYQDFSELDGKLNGQLNGQLDGQLDGHNIRKKEREESKKEDLSVSYETDCCTDVQRVISAWNSLGLGQVRKVIAGSNRDAMLKKRLKDYGVDELLTAVENIRNSRFLQGENKNGWVATFDWFIKPNNFAKVLEKNYDDRLKGEGQNRNRAQSRDASPSGVDRLLDMMQRGEFSD